MKRLNADINACRNCVLCENCLNRVPGEGNEQARLMLVGEGPGQQEDLLGRPFVGPAGQLLDKMIAAMGLSRSEVFIANAVKCRPPSNRTPFDSEVETCLPFLRRQVRIVQPELIVALGRTAARCIIDSEIRINSDHGRVYERKGYWMMATYHPSALLRDDSKKRPCWEDLKKVIERLSQSR